MKDVFAGVAGGGKAAAYLQSALSSGKTTHAYLIVGGSTGAGLAIATRFAAALVADGDEEQFSLACQGAHPDVRVMEPGSSAGYLVEQVRELVHDAELAPIRAHRKVYLVLQADRMQSGSANAFLKTLEEPPADVVCILLADNEQSVLETLRSRCEVLALSGDGARRSGDSELFSMLSAVCSGCDNRTVISYARRFVELASAEADVPDGSQLESRDEDFLSASAKRELEKRGKRIASTRQRAALLGQVELVSLWLRDCLMVQQGAVRLSAYPECADQVMAVATSASDRGIVEALAAVRSCAERISYNVSPQLAVEAMFIEIREALCQQ